MGKHVCPVCEDVYAIRAAITLGVQGSTPASVEAWGCPSCDYQFVSYDDVVRLVQVAAGPDAAKFTWETEFLAERKIVFREDVQPKVRV